MNIEEQIIRDLSKDIKVPYSYDIAIRTALNKKRKPNIILLIRNVIIWIVSVLSVLCGSFGVYAATGGEINGIPAFEWIGINFSSSYVDYKQEVKETTTTYNKTSVELVGTLASDYVTVLEFDVKLSEEDKEFLRLGETVYMEQDDVNLEESLKQIEENYQRTLSSIDEMYSDEEEAMAQQAKDNYKRQYETEKKFAKENVEENKKYINTLQLGFNKEQIDGEIDFFENFPHSKDNIILDGEEIWCRNFEDVEKIADNEYKVYHVFLLTDDDLKGKTSYNITLKNNIIANNAQLKHGENPQYEGMTLSNTPNNARRIDIEGEFSVDVSKEKILADSNIIKLTDKKSSYKNVTQEIEEINVNPIQTIIRTKTIISGVSSNTRYDYGDEKQCPLWVEFKIKDENGKELKTQSFETKKILTKADGTVEEWYPGDIDGSSVYKDGTFELTEYIILENNNTNKITITPSFQALDREAGEEVYTDLPDIEIDLT